MSLTIAAEAPPLTVLDGGAVRVTGTRMPLELLIRSHVDLGWSAEKIAKEYAPLALADVYAVLTYYYRHREEVEEYLAQSDAAEEEIQQKLVALRGTQRTRTEMLQSRAFAAGDAVPASGVWRSTEGGAARSLTKGDRFPPGEGGEAVSWTFLSDVPAVPQAS